MTDPRAEEIIGAILARDARMPVRTLEDLLSRGDAGFGMLILAARQSIERHRCPGFAHWSAVALGELGDPDAAPELMMLMRWAWRAPAVDTGFSAAEAIGKLGEQAEEALLRNAELTRRHERYWFHYAAACMATQRASDWVLSELERNVPLADSAALSLALLGRTDALPALDRALRRVRTWQLPLIAEAVKSLHGGPSVVGTFARDWRLRYRYQPGFGRFPPLLPCLVGMLRSQSAGRGAAAGEGRSLPRSVDAILSLAQSEPAREEPRCDVCHRGRPALRTGLVLCDQCAPAAAQIQADCLLGVDCRSNDVFDVLNVIDYRLMEHDRRQFPETEEYRRFVLARSACYWLVEHGVESVAAGVAMLLDEADRDAGRTEGADPPDGPEHHARRRPVPRRGVPQTDVAAPGE